MQPRKILVVEDNENNLRLFRILLNRPGWELFLARDGEEALRTISEEEPDLIVLDIQIPKVSGLDLVERVRSDPDRTGTKIIAVTAYAMNGDREKILQAGCDGYVSKPIDTRAFPGIVASFLPTNDVTSESARILAPEL